MGCQEHPAASTSRPSAGAVQQQTVGSSVVPLRDDQGPNDVIDSVYGLTRMHIAARDGNVPYLEYLIRNGGNVDVKSSGGRGSNDETPLHWSKTSEIASVLLTHGADRDSPAAYGQTALHSLAFRNRLDAVKAVLMAGADINRTDPTLGWNAVGWACSGLATDGTHDDVELRMKTRTSLIRYLVKNGGDVNQRNNDGQTVLHLIVMSGKPEFVKLLLTLGVDSTICDAAGMRPVDIARDNDLREICDLLE